MACDRKTKFTLNNSQFNEMLRLYGNGALKEALSILDVILSENFSDADTKDMAGSKMSIILKLIVEIVMEYKQELFEKDVKIGELAALIIQRDLDNSPEKGVSLKKIEGILNAGREKETLQVIREVLGLFPEQPQVMLKLGEFLIEQGEFDRAHEIFSHGLLCDNGNAELWSDMSYVCHNLGDKDSAVYAAKMAVNLEPENALYKENLDMLIDLSKSNTI
jgi:predicted Zn-dependent protease